MGCAIVAVTGFRVFSMGTSAMLAAHAGEAMKKGRAVLWITILRRLGHLGVDFCE
jgi:hypothetical protein